MNAIGRRIDPAAALDEAGFAKGDDVRMAGPLASTACFAVGWLAFLMPDRPQAIWAYAAGAAFVVAGGLIAAAALTASRLPLSRRALRFAPWFLLFAVLADVWQVLLHVGLDARW